MATDAGESTEPADADDDALAAEMDAAGADLEAQVKALQELKLNESRIQALKATYMTLCDQLEHAMANRVEDLRSRTASVGVRRQRSDDVGGPAGSAPRLHDGAYCAEAQLVPPLKGPPLEVVAPVRGRSACGCDAVAGDSEVSSMDVCIMAKGGCDELVDLPDVGAASLLHGYISRLNNDDLWRRPEDVMAQVRELERLCGELAAYAAGHPLAYPSSFYPSAPDYCAEPPDGEPTPPLVTRASTTGSMVPMCSTDSLALDRHPSSQRSAGSIA